MRRSITRPPPKIHGGRDILGASATAPLECALQDALNHLERPRELT